MDTFVEIVWIILPTILTIITPAIYLLVRRLVLRMTTKIDTELGAAIENMILGVVTEGISYAEQKAKQYQKSTRNRIDSSDKLATAINYIIQEMHKRNLPDLTADQIEEKIECCLGMETMGINAMNSSGDEDDDDIQESYN